MGCIGLCFSAKVSLHMIGLSQAIRFRFDGSRCSSAGNEVVVLSAVQV